MFTFFKKLSDPLTLCLLSERRFRGRTECGEGETGDMIAEGVRERGRFFILSDKEKSWIGVYHTFNWTSSLCLAGRCKWTTEMCQLAPRPSTSPVHSFYQPLTISVSLSSSLSLLFPPSRLGSASASFLHLPASFSFSLCSLLCIPGI